MSSQPTLLAGGGRQDGESSPPVIGAAVRILMAEIPELPSEVRDKNHLCQHGSGLLDLAS